VDESHATTYQLAVLTLILVDGKFNDYDILDIPSKWVKEKMPHILHRSFSLTVEEDYRIV
jgi:hypothetical protein